METVDHTDTPTTTTEMKGEMTDISEMTEEMSESDLEHEGTTEQSYTVTDSPLTYFIKVL